MGILAKTYGLLPSEVLARATTYDIMVADVLTTWENHQQNPNKTDHYDPKALAEIVEKTRNGS